LTVVYNNIRILERQFNNEEEIIEYAKEQANQLIDIQNKLPYTIELASYDVVKSKRGVLIFKCDHLLTDGLGIANLFALLSDNYSPDMFPRVIKPYSFNLWEYILDLLYGCLSVLYIPYFCYQLISFKSHDTPLKIKRQFGNCQIGISKAYSLDTFSKIRKELEVSFNDIIVSAITEALYRVSKEEAYNEQAELVGGITVGVRYQATNTEELELTNKATGFVKPLPYISDYSKLVITISNLLKKHLNNIPLIMVRYKLFSIISEFIPVQLFLDFNEQFGDKIDFLCSNIPGTQKELIYAGSRVKDSIAFAFTGGIKLFIPILSYNKKFRVAISVNDCIDFNKENFLNYLDIALNKLIKSDK
jgi:hypothetical protein